MLTTQDLIGAWSLQNFETEKDGAYSPWGPAMRGLLLYSQSGHVSAALNRRVGDPGFDSVADCLFYAGTFTLTGNEVAHQIEIATNAKRIGTTILRKASLNQGLLTLTGISDEGRPFRLVWKKL